MALLTVQTPALTGAAITYAAASAGGDTFPGGQHTIFSIKNGSGSSITVTFDSITPCNQGFDHNLVVTVPATSERTVGPFPARFWGTGNEVSVTYSAVTTATVAAIVA